MNIAAQPQGAQLPLDGFELPDFPIQAQGLMALTLLSVRGQQSGSQAATTRNETSEEIASLSVRIPPSLPRGIQSLTIESFESGFATGFLSGLADHLADLKSLVFYRCRLGVGGEGEAKFFAATGLRALHLLDVDFHNADDGLIQKIAAGFTHRMEKGLMFLEVGYTQDGSRDLSSDERLASALPALICPSLITVKFNVQLPDKQDKIDSSTAVSSAITPFPTSYSTQLVASISGETTRPRPLKALNLTLYTLTISSLHAILSHHPRLLILNVTVETPDPSAENAAVKLTEWKAALNAAISQCEELEQLEIVANPLLSTATVETNGERLSRNAKASQLGIFPAGDDLKRLSVKCSKLNEFKGSILRNVENGHVLCERRGGQWIGGMKGI